MNQLIRERTIPQYAKRFSSLARPFDKCDHSLEPDIEETAMSRGYQRMDAHFIDYQLYELPGVNGVFRGPPIQGSDYVACVGAAQTFGRFAHAPYPRLLADALGVETLNLGRGGVGPSFPLGNSALMQYINHAKVVILQVFSGRSQSNSLFHIAGYGLNGVNVANRGEMSVEQFYSWLVEQGPTLTRAIVSETRQNYLQTMIKLLETIKPPKILLWFSVRSPEYKERLELPLTHLWGAFPHFINQEMISQLQSSCDTYVECISRRGLPQAIPHRLSSLPPFDASEGSSPRATAVAENRYYPSPEMHEDAAALLIPSCRALLDRH